MLGTFDLNLSLVDFYFQNKYNYSRSYSIFMKLKTLITVGLVAAPVAAFAGPSLNGAGATFPAPVYQRWFSDYASATGNRVNYQSVGSGAGIRQFVAGTVDFAASDEPITSKDAAKVKRGVVQFPAVGGTIAVAYNKPGCSLKLTQKQVVGIFEGTVKDWKALGCAAGPITTVHRSDASGTTYAFTSSLNAFGGWSAGAAKAVSWATGIAAKGNEGVSATLQKTPGSIGYIATPFVKSAGLQAAAVENKSGKFVKPTITSGSAALNSISLDGNLAGENFNPSNPAAYPISTLTWILAYKNGNGAKAAELQKIFDFMLSNNSDDC
jgi:phosphate transport system substrate-binding protein